ncbi:LCP family protein [Oceanobacillus senegalensis]|uniref:LCP family protein n=1 Tax=Oceanobacillus senegalensis TaxID=1936063 RepID=UPI000A30C2A0|nr:LCP family protein [Oceanobacillus senegalensis]
MSDKNQTPSRLVRKRRRRKFRRRLYFLLVLCFIAFFVVASYAAYLYVKAGSVMSESYEGVGREKSELRETAVDPSKDNFSMLIIGADESEERDNEGAARSDTLMLATFNKEDKSVKLVSIPRDSLVYIPEVDRETKINHAYAYGGAKATIETVEHLLDIPVDYHVTLNFEAFIDVVNALNGITVDVPYELYEQNSDGEKGAIHLLPGEQQLNGEQALALARTRKLDNDIERGKRQQEIIKAAMDKAISVGSVFKYDDVIEAVGDNMTTNMTFSEIKSLISYGTSGTNLDIETYTLEGSDYQPGSVYYWKLDETVLEEIKLMLKEHLEIS